MEGDRRPAGRRHRGPHAARRPAFPRRACGAIPRTCWRAPWIGARPPSRGARRPNGGRRRRAKGGESTTTRGGSEGLRRDLRRRRVGRGVLAILLLPAAFGWGALHALSPGHGKTMVAAYLVGTRGTARHALALGATVTVTHTIGVFALGLVTLALSQYVLPEDLYPWLTLVPGPAGGGGGRGRAALADPMGAREAIAPAASTPTTTTTITRPLPRARPFPRGQAPSPPHARGPELARAGGHGRRRGTDPLPLGPGRPAGGDLAARGGPGAAAHSGVQPWPGRHAERAGPGGGLCASACFRAWISEAAWPPRCPRYRPS